MFLPHMLFTTVFLVIIVPATHAMEEGNPQQGLQKYWQHCQGCHPKGPDFGPVGTQSKIQKQWLRYFKKDRHKKSHLEAWDDIPALDLIDIQRYLHDHAADSDPVRCGSCWQR